MYFSYLKRICRFINLMHRGLDPHTHNKVNFRAYPITSLGSRICYIFFLTVLLFSVNAGSIYFDVQIERNEIHLQPVGNYTRIFLKDGICQQDQIGGPDLPARYVRIAIPSGAQPTSIQVNGTEEIIADGISIYPVLSQESKTIQLNTLMSTNNISCPYPQKSAVLQGIQQLHGYTLAVVRINVLRYRTDTKQLFYTPHTQVTLLYTDPPVELLNGLSVVKSPQSQIPCRYPEEVTKWVINPDDISSRTDSLMTKLEMEDENTGDIPYVIITNDTLKETFQQLADYRISQGTSAVVKTMDWIRNQYDGTRPDGQEDDPTRIRNFISDYYLNYGTRWVVLGGDDEPVPVRYCSTSYCPDIPCDLYYGCLDGTWDADNDGIYGEIDDEVDFASEVWIGRIPVQTPEETAAYIQKIMTYESLSPDGFADTMLLQANSGNELVSGLNRPFGFLDHDPLDAWEIQVRQLYYSDNWGIQNFWQASHLSMFFETYTSWDQQYCGDYDYGYVSCNVLEKLNWGYHYIFNRSHGNTDFYASVSTVVAAEMTNANRPSIFWISSCSTAHFDQCEQCLSEVLLRNPNGGAVIYIGYTRSGWLRTDDARFLFSELYENNCPTIGQAHSNSRAFLATVNTADDQWRDLLFMISLQGDPGLRILGRERGRQVQIISPGGCEVIDQRNDIWIRWNASGTDFMSDETVRLDYSSDGGQTWQPIPGAEQQAYNNRRFLWENHGLALGSEYRIRVTSNTNPVISDASRVDFTIGKTYILGVLSSPTKIWVEGSHENFTEYTYNVPEGSQVNLCAESLPKYNFIRWKDANNNTITRNMTLSFQMTGNKTITAEYESPEALRDYYVNDDIAEELFAPGSSENDGCSPANPVRNIQEIINRYSDIRAIHVSAGTYHENVTIDSRDPNIILQGNNRENTILDGQELGSCLKISNAGNITIQDFTFRNGRSPENVNGGGVSISHADSVQIIRNYIKNNFSGCHGGGICIDNVSGHVDFSKNDIFNNTGSAVGGGVSFLNCKQVGACDNQVYINNSKICGGIWFFQVEQVELFNNLVQNNQCNENGGGLFLQLSPGTIFYNEIINNSASGSGGGIFCVDTSQLSFFSNLVSENTANGSGGGIYNHNNGQTELTNCTIGNNTAPNGAGIYNSATELTINNSILWGNSPTQIINASGTPLFIYNSDIQGGIADITDSSGNNNIETDPLFVDQNNTSNYLLTPLSPCIDTGSNALLPLPILLDLSGKNRIIEGNCQSPENVDIGAYEFDWISIGDFAGGCNVNLEDFFIFASTWLSVQGDSNYNPVCDIGLPLDNYIDKKDLEQFFINWLMSN